MAFLEISNLQKSYGPAKVVRDFDLEVEQGEFVSFLGPSGCGKTTTLRMVAGFETPSDGIIRIDGRDVVDLKPSRRGIGMVFQAYALFPNMTVAQNVAFGLRVAGEPRAAIDARVSEMLGIIKLPRHNHPIFESDRFEGATDDKFFISIEADDGKFDLDRTKALLESTNPTHLELIEEEVL